MKAQLQLWRVFYQSVVASALFAEVCWGSSIGGGNVNRINELMTKTSSVIGCNLDSFTEVAERRPLINRHGQH